MLINMLHIILGGKPIILFPLPKSEYIILKHRFRHNCPVDLESSVPFTQEEDIVIGQIVEGYDCLRFALRAGRLVWWITSQEVAELYLSSQESDLLSTQ